MLISTVTAVYVLTFLTFFVLAYPFLRSSA